MPKKTPPVAGVSLGEMFGTIADGLVKQNILGYAPHAKQSAFHKSPAKIRLYIGGNRSGKTVGGIVEDIYYLTGEHPFRRVPKPPIKGRVVCVDFTYGINQIIIPQFQKWMPPSLLINGSWIDSYRATEKVLTLANGSMVEFMTYEQKTEQFAGTSREFIHFDEEPPKHIFTECQARLVDVDGDLWITMTPIEGMTWVYDTIYTPGTEGSKIISVVEVDMLDNPFISPEAAEMFLSGLDADERDAREHGKFVQLGGLVYKKFNPEIHVVPAFIPPKEWEWYTSMDHGYRNPTAWLWHAVARDGTVVTFDEHYESERVVREHAVIVNTKNAAFGKTPDYIIGDPATQQRQGVTGTSIAAEYAEYGIYIAPGNNDVTTGVNQVNSYLGINPETGKPYWQITENCVNLIQELKRLRWQTWASKKAQEENNPRDKIHKKDDHATDAARYFFSFMPDLRPEITVMKEVPPVSTINRKYDEILNSMVLAAPDKTKWNIYSGSDTSRLEYEDG